MNIRIIKSNLNTNRSIATDISGIYLIKIRSEIKNVENEIGNEKFLQLRSEAWKCED